MPTADPRAWRADTLDPPAAWYQPLSDRCLAELDRCLRPGPATDLRPTDALRDAAAEDVRRAHAALEDGRGFVVLTVPPGRYSTEQLPGVYWLVGHLLGRPIAQNVQGTVLYDVKDTGQDVRYGARFSVTNAESSFHTDNSFGDEVADYVGLLCLRPARSGGESQIVSGYAVRRELADRQPEALQQLGRPFHVDRRGGLRPGDAPTARYPVLGGDRDLMIRYLRYWIEVGHENAGEPLTAAQVAAMDALDRTASDPRLRATFTMRPGDMLFVNNRWILHNRTAFEDFTEPEQKRHLVRLWLSRKR